jgi:hypothetical protein
MEVTGAKLYEPLVQDLAAKIELGAGDPGGPDVLRTRLRNNGGCS